MKLQSLPFIIFSFFLFSCKGQKPQVNAIPVVDRFVDHYNSKKFDSIFYLFSPEMKEYMALPVAVDFFESIDKSSGKINDYQFIDSSEGFARYRTFFTDRQWWLGIAANQEGKISGLYFKPYDSAGAKPLMLRNSTRLSLPFTGEWFVFWGGDTKEQNYHVISQSQKNAFDLVQVGANGRTFKSDGKKNDDYYAFGQPILSVCDAIVEEVTEGIGDNDPGVMNPRHVTGNSIILKTKAGEYILYAHFKSNSLKVKKGDTIKKGQVLGLCGNSGNSSEPHLHFHIQDKADMISSYGVKCHFEKIKVNGTLKTDYSPVKGERIQNAN